MDSAVAFVAIFIWQTGQNFEQKPGSINHLEDSAVTGILSRQSRTLCLQFPSLARGLANEAAARAWYDGAT